MSPDSAPDLSAPHVSAVEILLSAPLPTTWCGSATTAEPETAGPTPTEETA